MPKFDPSILRSDPVEQAATRPHDLLPAEKFIARIKGMLVGEEYTYAEDTLRSILKFVERTGSYTSDMERAIANIEGKPKRERRGESRWSK